MLKDIGWHRYSHELIRFYECTECGSLYPCATSQTPTGHLLDYRRTTGPMMNGREIADCPCVKDNK